LLTRTPAYGENFNQRRPWGRFRDARFGIGQLSKRQKGDSFMTLALQMQGYRLTTADITYWRPDHPRLLQSFIWQDLDLAPKFPVLSEFLDFWHRNLDGRLHEVRVASEVLVKPAEFRLIDGQINLH
jgi:uncharacterized protein Usg